MASRAVHSVRLCMLWVPVNTLGEGMPSSLNLAPSVPPRMLSWVG